MKKFKGIFINKYGLKEVSAEELEYVFLNLKDHRKLSIIYHALGYMQGDNSRTRGNCLAQALGYDVFNHKEILDPNNKIKGIDF